MFAYSKGYECKRAVLVYPALHEDCSETLRQVSDEGTLELEIRTVPLARMLP